MKIKFLGTGSALVTTNENYHSNVLITKEDDDKNTKTLLIDAGFHIGDALDNYGYDVHDINSIFITHNHGDHNMGLEYIGFKTYFSPYSPDKFKPILFADPKVLDVLWNNVLKGNMDSLNGRRSGGIGEYFNVKPVPPRRAFQFLNTEFHPIRMPHIVDDHDEVPAFGLKWQEDDVKFIFTGDTIFDFWRLMPFWEWGDVVFQECEFAEYDNSVHCQFRQLKALPDTYKSKMWLYHYMLNGKTYEELEKEVKAEGFAGLIKRGQEFDTKEIKEIKK